MTRLIVILDLEKKIFYVEDDPRTPRELAALINSGQLVVGTRQAKVQVRQWRPPRQWALAHSAVETVTVLMQPPPVRVSPRMYQVLYALAAGQTVEQIAAELAIRRRTVYLHVSVLKERFGARSLAQLIHRAVEKGMLEAEE